MPKKPYSKTPRDDVIDRLMSLTGDLPEPRLNLSEDEKDAVVASVGPKTAVSVINAKKDMPVARIPWIFSSIDTQAVLDLLHNDMSAAIDRAQKNR